MFTLPQIQLEKIIKIAGLIAAGQPLNDKNLLELANVTKVYLKLQQVIMAVVNTTSSAQSPLITWREIFSQLNLTGLNQNTQDWKAMWNTLNDTAIYTR